MKRKLIIIGLLTFSIGVVAQKDLLIGNVAPPDPTLQERSFVPHDHEYHVGDTVIININCTRYLTGETPSDWVYNVRHVIQQIGGGLFPKGVLLGGINTWVSTEDLKIEHLVPVVIPEIKEETPEVNEETPISPVVVPVVQEETPEVKEETPVIPVVVPAAQEETPEVKEETPVIPVVVPAAQEETPEVKEEIPEVKEEIPVIPIVVPAAQEEDVIQMDSTKSPQIDRCTMGARAGVASFLQETFGDAKRQLGCDVLLDIQYAHYWIRKKDNKFGFLIGLSVGYAQGGLKEENYRQNYSLVDPDGWKAQYSVSVDKIRETDQQIQLEIPVMFSMITAHGFFLNVGPRFLLPVYTPYLETMENPDIRAYFEKTDVEVRNEVITGRLSDNQLKTSGKTKNAFKLNITLGLELGYEWQLKNDHSLGLGAYFNYGVYSMYENDTELATPIIEVTPAIPAVVTTQSAADSWTKKMGYVDGGIKIAYHFNWER